MEAPDEVLAFWEEMTQGLSDTMKAFLVYCLTLQGEQMNYSEKEMKEGKEDANVINYLFIEWRTPDIKLPWPFGTIDIPVAILGKARLGDADLGMTEENGIFPEELLGKKWQR